VSFPRNRKLNRKLPKTAGHTRNTRLYFVAFHLGPNDGKREIESVIVINFQQELKKHRPHLMLSLVDRVTEKRSVIDELGTGSTAKLLVTVH
jgi:hypothetical protein